MISIELYLGGCRSGKSAAALQRALQIQARRSVFIATCQPGDAEMRARVERHRRERGDNWETFEEPLAIAELILRHSDPQTIFVVDCLTLWLTNMILDDSGDEAIEREIAGLAAVLGSARGPVLLVANEVGLGIVPENALSRRFRDWAGSLNQQMARCATGVFLTVAGLAVPIKTTTGEDRIQKP
jgi:adenosylcobinamide kinase/adenosylcobinamide-phosphate guanylyltransferase